MLDAFSNTALSSELRAAQQAADRRLRSMRRLKKRYAGGEVTGTDQQTDLENHAFEFISLVLPQIIFENPRMSIAPKRLEIWDFAQSLQREMNQWIRDTDVRKQFMMSAVDDAFLAAPLMTVPTPAPGFDPSEPDVPFEPRIYRLSPEQFGFDSRVSFYEQARFAYHTTIRDKEDLMRDALIPGANWNPQAIMGIAEREFNARAWNPLMAKSASDSRAIGEPAVQRKEIQYHEVWVPEIELEAARRLGGADSGFHGTIFTISLQSEGNGTFIREPYPYFGPSWGPYAFQPWYNVPDDPFGMSPLGATQTQANQYNQLAQVMSEAVKNYKRLMLVSEDESDLAEKIQNKPHDFVVPVSAGFDAKASVLPTEIGGLTDQMLIMDDKLKERLDRNSGITETQRGAITKASATEIEEAGASSGTRTAFMKLQFMSKCRRALKTAAWYFAFDERVLRNSGFQGGLPPGTHFEDMDVDVDVTSFGRVSERQMQQRALLELQIATQLAQLGATVVGVDVQTAAEVLSVDLNMPNLPKMFNAEALQAQAMLSAIQGAAPGGGEGTRAQSEPSKGNDSRSGFSRGASAAATAKR